MKPLLWLEDEITSPPFGDEARNRAVAALNVVCLGELPHGCKALPVIGSKCFRIRINDKNWSWRIVFHIAAHAVVVLHVFQKETRHIPKDILDVSRKRLRRFLREQGDINQSCS